MKVNEDKNIEKLIDHLMKDTMLESPSFDFTSKVMSQVLEIKTSNVTTYKPLISKPVFIALFSGLTAVLTYLFFNGNASSNNAFLHLNYNLLHDFPVETFRFSKITVYSVVLTTLMLFIQIPLLKNYFDRKYNS
jgi:hypothetical protein